MNVITHLIIHGLMSSPELEHSLRWPKYAAAALATVFFVGVLLPDAWHYRRADPGGLFFVLCMIAMMVGFMWSV